MSELFTRTSDYPPCKSFDGGLVGFLPQEKSAPLPKFQPCCAHVKKIMEKPPSSNCSFNYYKKEAGFFQGKRTRDRKEKGERRRKKARNRGVNRF